MDDLRITLLQTELVWENIEANLQMFDSLLKKSRPKTDLVLLPEMFTTGFTMNAAPLAEKMDGRSVTWMQENARRFQCDLLGSLIIQEESDYFNRLIWAKPDGAILQYDKRHLFRMSGEESVYRPGAERLIVELKGWKILPLICYDLRFPVWSRNTKNEYDLAVYIANWPEKRAYHWNMLLPARAVENQVYVAAVNRIGKDGNGHNHAGDSCVFNPLGETLFHSRDEETRTLQLSGALLEEYRAAFPSWKDADQFKIDQASE